MKYMQKLLLVVIFLFLINPSIAQTVGTPHFDVQGPLYTRENIYSQNKAGTGWVGWDYRNISLSEIKIEFENILSINKYGGNLAVGNGIPYKKSCIRARK